jgi:hypothetical protein
MKIKLKAMGETSPLTEGKKLVRGAVVETTKAKAAEAIKSGRWVEVTDPKETPAGEANAEGAGN